MGNDRLAKNASILIFLVAIAMAPGPASAGGQKPHGKQGIDSWASYPVPMQRAYLFAGAIADPYCSACCYTFPIQAVYQCPAVLAGQPGSRVGYLQAAPMSGFLGGQSYLYHP